MQRWTGTWLAGPGVTLGELHSPDTWPGSRLGLPREGRGAVATFSVRVIAFLADIAASGLASGLVLAFLAHPTDRQRQAAGLAVLFVESALLVALTGQTLGMRVTGLQVLRLKDPTRVPGLAAGIIRMVPLIASLGLVGFFTKDGRGLHDLAAGTVVVRSS